MSYKRLVKVKAEKFAPHNIVYCQQFLNYMSSVPANKIGSSVTNPRLSLLFVIQSMAILNEENVPWKLYLEGRVQFGF